MFLFRSIPRPLLAIILLGLAIRAIFLLVGAAVFYHSSSHFYFNGDSDSYIKSFENLWQNGHYTFDFLAPDASFGRLPGYPFFYGFHYLLFGAALAPAATAWSQVLLDTGAILLVFRILKRLEPINSRAAYLGALFYSTYPFIVVWVPVIGTETLSTDLTLCWLYAMLAKKPSATYSVGLGVLIGLSLLVREYMGVLLPITLIWVLRHSWVNGMGWQAIRQAALICFGFGLLYSGWPVRNYILAHRLIWLKPHAAGYANQTLDVDEFYRWVHCWDANENPWLDSVLVGKGPVHFPPNAFSSIGEEIRCQQLVALARQCGSGFYVISNVNTNRVNYKNTTVLLTDTIYQRYRTHNCNAVVGNGFKHLRHKFAEQQPVRFWLDVPFQNLRKAIFKQEMVTGQALNPHFMPRPVGLLRMLFGYRTVLLLLGWGGLFVCLRRYKALWLVLAVGGFQYVYICYVYRGLEMRYLLQADVLLLLPAALLLVRWQTVFKRVDKAWLILRAE